MNLLYRALFAAAIFFVALNYAAKPAEALRIAKKEMERRQDIFMRDAYAWAIQANGGFAEAHAEMIKALSVGFRDPVFLYHAGMIAMKNGQTLESIRYLRGSLKQAEQSSVAKLVHQALESQLTSVNSK